MAEHPIQGLMGVTIEKIRDMVDTSTIIGDPIHVDDATTIIPVSRVTFGFASGGSDVAPQSDQADVRRRHAAQACRSRRLRSWWFPAAMSAPYSWWKRSPPWTTPLPRCRSWWTKSPQ